MKTFVLASCALVLGCGQSAPPPSDPISVPTASVASASPTPATPPTPTPAPSSSADPNAGLGLSGVGEGAGGRGEGIGLGNIGTIGGGDAGARDGGKSGKAPSLRQGATQVNGRLPPEVIQRIVRQNFGKIRKCYETALAKDATVQGRVAVKFVIDRTGAVSTASDGGSDMPDKDMVKCVVAAFTSLKYPQPEGGIVTVVYPIIFSPGD